MKALRGTSPKANLGMGVIQTNQTQTLCGERALWSDLGSECKSDNPAMAGYREHY